MPKNNRLEQQRAEKREKILKAAVRIFAEKGFYNTRIAEIARDAGVADGTIYLYFKNKDDILITVFEESVADILASFREKLQGLDNPVDKLKAFIRLHLNIVKSDPDLASVLQLELRQSNKFIKEYTGHSFTDYLFFIREIIEEGQQKRLFRDDLQIGLIKRVLFGALDEISTYWVMQRDKEFDVERNVEQVSSLFLHGLLHRQAGVPAQGTNAKES